MAEAAASDAAEVHVLAVDDCLIDRVLIGRLLSSDSVKVTTVDSALSALELLGLQDEHRASSNACCNPLNFSLIITDYCMPGMTGYDLLKKLKGTKDFKEIPVVIMSSESVPQRIQRCLEEGAKDFILKPVQLKDVKKLRGHIKRTKSTSAPPICGKRKVSSIVIRGEESERRHHLGGVTVA